MTAPDARFAVRMPPEVCSVQLGEHPVIFIDDFLQEPQALLDAACTSRFERCPGVAHGMGYPGMRADAPRAYADALCELLDPLIKLNFGVDPGLALRRSACSFSLTTVAPRALGPLQRTPHFDSSSPNHMAVLLYLCDERHGGTGFYRHRATGLQQITAQHKDRYASAYYAELERRPPPPRYFDAGDEHFEFLGMLPARFNRLAIYSGGLLHSACINPGRSINADPRTGRLTVNLFIDF